MSCIRPLSLALILHPLANQDVVTRIPRPARFSSIAPTSSRMWLTPITGSSACRCSGSAWRRGSWPLSGSPKRPIGRPGSRVRQPRHSPGFLYGQVLRQRNDHTYARPEWKRVFNQHRGAESRLGSGGAGRRVQPTRDARATGGDQQWPMISSTSDAPDAGLSLTAVWTPAPHE